MATTLTQFTPQGRTFPFIGIGIPAAQFTTWIPSAEVIFVLPPSSAITVAAAGEDQEVRISCNLPRSFCYVLVESTLRVRGLDAADWDKAAHADLTDSAGSDDKTSIPLNYENVEVSHISTTLLARDYRLLDPPSKLIVPQANDDALLRVQSFNPTVDGAVGVVKFYARFLRYDRNQAQFWQVNTPILVR